MFSLCEHHLLSFFGKVHVAYVPQEKVIRHFCTTRKTAVSTSRERRPKSFGISRFVLMLLRPILAQFHKGAEQLRVEAQPSLRSK